MILPPLLALVPRGAAPLAAFAGLCAAGVVAADPAARRTGFGVPAVVLGMLLLWAAGSSAWSIHPARSLLIDLRLLGLFAAALALAMAAGAVAAPRRLALFAIGATGVAIVLALYDLASAGGLARHVTVRPFIGPRLNQISVWTAMLALPVAALLACRNRPLLGAAAGCAMAATVYLLDGTAAKTALTLSLPVAALLYWRRGPVARIAAGVSVLAILTAPLTFPHIADNRAVFETADGFKESLGHRLLIWRFTGDHIAQRPLLGWGLDSSRSIPGGKELIRPRQSWLPLHPHNAALQVWLELGAPGAVLFAVFMGWLWLRIGAAPWPRLYVAAAGGCLAAASSVAFAAWGIWQEWWLATLGCLVFVLLAGARAAGEAATPRPPSGSPASGR